MIQYNVCVGAQFTESSSIAILLNYNHLGTTRCEDKPANEVLVETYA